MLRDVKMGIQQNSLKVFGAKKSHSYHCNLLFQKLPIFWPYELSTKH